MIIRESGLLFLGHLVYGYIHQSYDHIAAEYSSMPSEQIHNSDAT